MTTLKPRYAVDLRILGGNHFYLVNNSTNDEGLPMPTLYPGVTGFLQIINKPALIPWAKKEALNLVRAALEKSLADPENILIDQEWVDKVIAAGMAKPDKIKDDAADLGTKVHKYIDQVINGKIPSDLTPEMEPAITAFFNWWTNSKIQIVMGDTKVASIVHAYGGSLDALGRQDGNYVILDWKTSNGIYDEMALQVSAYAQAFAETYGVRCTRGYIVRFSKKLPIEFKVREIADLEASFLAFLAAKNLTNRMQGKHFL